MIHYIIKIIIFGLHCFSDLYLSQEIVLLNPYFMLYKSHKSDYCEKTFSTSYLKCCTCCFCCLFRWIRWIGGNCRCCWYFRSQQLFNLDKSSYILQLFKGKLKDLQKLFKYFNGRKTFVSNLLLFVSNLFIILKSQIFIALLASLVFSTVITPFTFTTIYAPL